MIKVPACYSSSTIYCTRTTINHKCSRFINEICSPAERRRVHKSVRRVWYKRHSMLTRATETAFWVPFGHACTCVGEVPGRVASGSPGIIISRSHSTCKFERERIMRKPKRYQKDRRMTRLGLSIFVYLEGLFAKYNPYGRSKYNLNQPELNFKAGESP